MGERQGSAHIHNAVTAYIWIRHNIHGGIFLYAAVLHKTTLDILFEIYIITNYYLFLKEGVFMKRFMLKRRRLSALVVSFIMMLTMLPGGGIILVSAAPDDVGAADAGKAASIGETEYDTLQLAIDSVSEGNSDITLLRDVSENIKSEGANFTLEMNGHKITPADPATTIFTINGGTVTLKSAGEAKGAITGAKSAANGGAINASGGAVITLDNIDITQNSAPQGGGIYLSASTLSLSNTYVNENTANGDIADMNGGGGAVAAVEGSNVTFNKGCQINNNKAASEGVCGTALYFNASNLKHASDGMTYMDELIQVRGNSAFESGENTEYSAALFACNESDIEPFMLDISENVNNHGVAAAYIYKSKFIAINCKFNYNQSGNSTLYIHRDYNNGTNVKLQYCDINNNKSKNHGTIYAERTAVTFDDCYIEKNESALEKDGSGNETNDFILCPGALELYSDDSAYPAVAYIQDGTVITGNIGHKVGGIGIVGRDDNISWGDWCALKIDTKSAVYGNTATYKAESGNPQEFDANDLWIPKFNALLEIPAASAMTDELYENNFTGYKWYDYSGISFSEAISKDELWNGNYGYVLGLTADVAAAQANDTDYNKVSRAIEYAGSSEIKLLRDVSENIATNNKSYTLDMQGHTITPKDPATTIFTITGGTVTIKNTGDTKGTITGANVFENGSAISAVGGAKLTLDNIIITENKSTGGGSASMSGTPIYMQESALDLNKVNISNNESKGGVGAVYINKSDFTATDCEFKDNKSGTSTVYLLDGGGYGSYLPAKKAVLTNCVISGNTSKRYGTVYVDDNDINLNQCRIENNTNTNISTEDFAAGALQLHSNDMFTATNAALSGTVITNNSGYKTGGIAVEYRESSNFSDAKYVSLKLDDSCAVYGNTAEYLDDPNDDYVGYANDLWLSLYMADLSVPDASTMQDSNNPVASSTGFKWIDNLGVAYEKLEKDTFSNNNPRSKSVFCLTAGKLTRDVAEIDGTPYEDIADAIENLGDDNKTIKLVQGENDDMSKTVVENVDINRDVEIDLNGRKLMPENPNSDAFVINSGTLTLSNTGTAESKVYSIKNGGTLNIASDGSAIKVDKISQESSGTTNVGKGAEIDTINNSSADVNITDGAVVRNLTHSGSGKIGLSEEGVSGGRVVLSGNVTVNKVTLAKDSYLTAGSNDLDLADNMIVTLDDGVLAQLNSDGDEEPTAILIDAGGMTVNDNILGKIKINGAKSNVVVTKDESGNVIAQKLNQKGIFVGGSGANDTNTGVTRDQPFSTLTKAIEEFGKLSEEEKEGAVIYVLGTIDVTSSDTWDMGDLKDYPIMRDPLFTSGPMVSVSGSGAKLTLSNIILDGYREQSVEARGPIIEATNGAKLVINDGAVLRNNVNTNNYYSFGGAVLANNAEVEMNGGEISNNTAWLGGGIAVQGDSGKLTMNNGTISGNSTSKWGTINGGGGGIAVIMGAIAIMNDGTVSNNTGGQCSCAVK